MKPLWKVPNRPASGARARGEVGTLAPGALANEAHTHDAAVQHMSQDVPAHACDAVSFRIFEKKNRV